MLRFDLDLYGHGLSAALADQTHRYAEHNLLLTHPREVGAPVRSFGALAAARLAA